ncbi:oxidoreductase [Zafaria cholistanensis]|uniref:Propionate 3-nitronate monooxygenase n=1 Tax=Zafaria cholistanensis TaxID=1682741 RepID=A0A5A7NSH3_9MICC|nr:nitronate monooxygenase [Zafaria cholistanensis]GER23743.1 oxidoreductase [Zafaria cholistanensis]
MPEERTSAGALRATGLLARLGASIPLVAAPMAGGPSTPELVQAAAGAGGLGFLAAGYKTPGQLAGEIAQVRAGTGRFGVNVFAPNPVPVQRAAFDAYVEALRDWAGNYGVDLRSAEPREDDDEWDAKVELLAADPVPVVTFTFGLPPAGTVGRLRRAGSLVLQTVTSAEEARRAAALGVDGLVIQSHLAGGHSGTLTPEAPLGEVPLVQLLGRVRAEVDLPLWAAGGLSTPAGVREVLAAGAEAAVLGTVLLRTPESGASAPYKAALADAARTHTSRTETLLTKAFSGRPARALRNGFVDRFHGQAPAGYPALHHLTSPLRKAAAAAGDPEGINIWAGAGYRDATEEPAADLLRRLAGTS